MATLSRKCSGNKGAAALVMLLALLAAGAGPAAGDSSTRPGCFVGWTPLNILYSLFCLLNYGTNPFGCQKDPPSGQGLSLGYYNHSDRCPTAEQRIREAVENATNNDRSIGAGLIRLHFHDAFVRGCDASVLLTTTATGNPDTERTGPPNVNSLRGFEVIDAAKAAVEKDCPGKVSCADILAFAARDASSILSYGEIYYEVPGGRLDGRESFAAETDQLPGPGSNEQDLKNAFAAQGLNVTDMVTLSGAHSVGLVRCLIARSTAVRPSDMNTGYAKYLDDTCAARNDSSFKVNQDNRTAEVLDNQYYKNIFDKFVLFKSDAALINSNETIDQVKTNANDSLSTWYTDFGYAMVKMGSILGNTTQNKTLEIRKKCWTIN